MRTPEQITNLRKVFSMIYGPISFFWSDENVEFIAEKLQTEINEKSIWTWEIRVMTSIEFEDWENIKPEPTSPCCTIANIKKKCEELLKKYPALFSILAVAKENSKLRILVI